MRCGYYNQNGCHMYIHGSFLWVLIFPIFAVFVFECILLANVRASINGTTELIGGHTVSWLPDMCRSFPGENAKQLELEAISHFFLE